MTRKPQLDRAQQRREVLARHADRRRELERAAVDPDLPDDVRRAAIRALHKLPPVV